MATQKCHNVTCGSYRDMNPNLNNCKKYFDLNNCDKPKKKESDTTKKQCFNKSCDDFSEISSGNCRWFANIDNCNKPKTDQDQCFNKICRDHSENRENNCNRFICIENCHKPKVRMHHFGDLDRSRPDGETIDQNSLLSFLSCSDQEDRCMDWNCDSWNINPKNNCKDYICTGNCDKIKQKLGKKENKTMHRDSNEHANALEKQFGKEKHEDVKIILKHCQHNLPEILLKMLLKDKADAVKAYAMDLETKEIAAEANKACKSSSE